MAAPSFFSSPLNCAFSLNKRNETLPRCPPSASWIEHHPLSPHPVPVGQSPLEPLVSCPQIHLYYNSTFSKRNSDYTALLPMIHLCHQNKIQIQHSSWTWSGPAHHPPSSSYSTTLLYWATCGFQKAQRALTLFFRLKISLSTRLTWPVSTHLPVSAGVFA